LSQDRQARRRELVEALTADSDVGGWVLRTAEARLGRTINHIDQAIDWLCTCLEREMAACLEVDSAHTRLSETAWRLKALVSRFESYEDQLSDFQGRLEREKLESMKELAYGASHEINNPLANIAARAQMLLVDEMDAERRRKLSAIHRQAMRAHEMIADLMLFARPPKLNVTSCNLVELVGKVVEPLRALADEYYTELVYKRAEQPIVAPADATQIGVAIHAIIVNALEAIGDGGHVWVAVRETNLGGDTWAEIAVRDDGPGISDEVRRHIFDPFYSGREAGRGLGFGLSKCWRLVTDHGGQVVVRRPATGGAEFDILLPLTAIAEAPS
jgi:signal transduction histidine kinase